MAQVTHTKGPWTLCDKGDYGDYDGECRVILGDDMSIRVAVVLAGGDAEIERESEANARLIAAAPDLLEALEELLTVAEMTTFSDQYPGECERARAAIVKARGQ